MTERSHRGLTGMIGNRRRLNDLVRQLLRAIVTTEVDSTRLLRQVSRAGNPEHLGIRPMPATGLGPVAARRTATTGQGDSPPIGWPRAENVIFSYDPTYTPAYQYFSIPSACIGGADTL